MSNEFDFDKTGDILQEIVTIANDETDVHGLFLLINGKDVPNSDGFKAFESHFGSYEMISEGLYAYLADGIKAGNPALFCVVKDVVDVLCEEFKINSPDDLVWNDSVGDGNDTIH